MKLNRTCKICETPFVAIKTTQLFCRRKCFKRDYYLRNKLKLSSQIEHPHFPKRTCAFCGTMQMIPYDPLRYPERFNNWECSACGVSNELLWRHQEKHNSFQIISAILSSIQIQPLTLQPVQAQYTVRASFLTIVTEVPAKPVSQRPVHRHYVKTQQEMRKSIAA